MDQSNVTIDPSAELGPLVLDSQFLAAATTCWMMLPPERRSVDEVIRILTIIFERCMNHMRENDSLFRPQAKGKA